MSESKSIMPQQPSPELKPGGRFAVSKDAAGAVALDLSVGEAMVVGAAGDGDEEIFAASVGSSEEVEFDSMVGMLEEVLVAPSFQATQDAFCGQHCGVFDDAEELKLEYTTLHRQYMDLLEGFIARECEAQHPEWSMERVLKVLGSGTAEDMTGDVFEMLHSMTDIQEFRQLMVSYKHAAEGTAPNLAIG